MNFFNFILFDINILILIAASMIGIILGAPRTVIFDGYNGLNYEDKSPAPLAFLLAVISVIIIVFRMMIYTAPVIGNLFGINLTLPEKNVLEISTGISTEKVISVSQKENYLQQVETETGVYEFSRNINTYEKYVFILKESDSIFVCFTSEVNIDECKKAKQIS